MVCPGRDRLHDRGAPLSHQVDDTLVQTLAGLPIPRGLRAPLHDDGAGDGTSGVGVQLGVPKPSLPRPAPTALSRRAEQHSRLQRRLGQMQMKRPVRGHHQFEPPGSTIWWAPSPQDPETHPCRLPVEVLLKTECDVKYSWLGLDFARVPEA